MKVTPDVTLWLTNELHKMLTKLIMAKENHPRIYYILVIMKDGYQGPPFIRSNGGIGGQEKTVDLSGKHVSHTRLVCINNPPSVPLIGTSLWRIDNTIGEAKCIYILPPDKPIILGTQMGEASKFIWKSAKNAPLIYASNN